MVAQMALGFITQTDLIVYIGIIGFFLGILFLFVFLYNRIIYFVPSSKENGEKKRPKVVSSIRNLLLIFLLTAVAGMAIFMGAFFRSYYAFNYEEPVAEVIIEPIEGYKASLVTLTQFIEDELVEKQFTITGDQWMIEGDMIKWEPWLNFLGVHTRFRLTRLRGRYISSEEEINQNSTVFSLVEDEAHPFWQYLFETGHQLPFISTVYGSAAYQLSGEKNKFSVFVSTSGLVVRKVD